MKLKYWLSSVAVAWMLSAMPAQALLVSSFELTSTTTIPSSWNVLFEGVLENQTYNGGLGDVTLQAEATFTLVSFANNQIDLKVEIKNTTFGDPVFGSLSPMVGVKSFGMDTNPNVTGVSFAQQGGAAGTFASPSGAGLIFTGVGLNETLPGYGGQGNRVDLCVYTPDSCQGGPIHQSLLISSDDTMVLSLTGSFGNTLTISNLAARFYGDFGSWLVRTTTPTEPPVPPDAIPEPATLGLLGLGMLAMGAIRRRKVALKR